MTRPDENELTDEELADLSALLENENLWAAPSAGLEDTIVAAIQAEAADVQSKQTITAAPVAVTPAKSKDTSAIDLSGPEPVSDDPHGGATVTPITSAPTKKKRRPGRLASAAAGMAASVVLLVGGFVAFQAVNQPDFQTVALTATPDGENASGIAQLERTDDGARILLDIENLAPAPEGTYYQAWLVRPEPKSRISAGTFHLRGGGDTEIELWSGVSPDVYSTITVTLQEEADPAGPGTLVLTGPIGG